MKICAIGDPHGNLEKIRKIPMSGVDLILITGDLGRADILRKMAFENVERKRKGLSEIKHSAAQKRKGYLEAYTSSMRIITFLKQFAPVFTIFGNVESSRPRTRRNSNPEDSLPNLANDLNAMPNVRVINNRVANFKGTRIGGLEYFVDTNWVQEFKPFDYKQRLAEAKKQTEKARKVLQWFDNLDILVTHQPPYGILDKVSAEFAPKNWIGKHAGSKAILQYVKRKQPKYVFCGHIHEGLGKKSVGKTKVYNLGVADYKIVELGK